MVATLCTDNAARHRQAGLTYLAILFAIAILGSGLALAGTVWHTAQQRDKEAELLFIGAQFRRALASYYHQSPGVRRFPGQLADLVKDPRFPNIKRHLRHLYVDPMTGQPVWAVVRNAEGGIIGVRSLSEQTPIKQHFADGPDKQFSGKTRYADWVFVYLPGMVL
jgi:type II secretory pathway pseudopilin PulG